MSDEPNRNRIVRKKRTPAAPSTTKDSDVDRSDAEKSPLLESGDNNNDTKDDKTNSKHDKEDDDEPPLKPQRSPRASADNDNSDVRDKNNDNNNNDGDGKENDETLGGKNRSRFRRARTDRPQSNDPSEAAALIANNANWREDKVTKPSTSSRGFFSSYFDATLCCKLGYDMKIEKRVVSNNRGELNELVRERTEGFCVGLRSLSVSSTGPSLPGMVKPSVKIHIVNRETGMYITNYRKVAVKPVYTYSCIPQDHTELPSWNQELLLDASYLDVVDEDSLMLFELLDERPSLKMNSNNARKSLSKRIAWGYLLPVGTKGHIHIGVKEGWKKDDKFNDKIDRRIERRRRRNDDDDDGKEDSKVEMNVTIQESPKVLDKSLRIQLYAVREDDGIIGYMQRKIMNWPSYSSSYNSAYPNGIPEVYIQWRRQKKIMLNDAALKFSIGPRNIETVVDFGGLPLIEAASAEEVGQGSTHGVVANILDVQNKGETSKLRAAVMRRSRSHREPCVIPEKLLHRLDAGPEGAMVVSYSHSGHLLAVSGRTLTLNAPLSDHNSSVASNIVYSLKLFDTDIGVEVWCMNSAHHGVVYDIRWSKDDSYIVTCSGDGTTKIWDVECYVRMGITASHGTPGKGVNADAVMSPGIRHQPYLAHVLRTVPPLYVYCAIFQEYSVAPSIDVAADVNVNESYEKQRAELPRVITGSSDGRIRVWNGSKLLGTLRIGDDDDPPHENRINSIVIDERTRYLLSGDSDGEILMWRADPKGWYQLLRKFRKDPSVAPLKSVNLGALDKKHVVSGVMSMSMHPDRNKAQMTVLTNKPTSLRVYSMTTYKTLSQCHGIISSSDQSSGLCRAQISGDGNYVVCGSSVNASEDNKYCLRVWETQSGNVEGCSLSDIVFPYPVRSVSWHPKQHVLAVGMVGQGAAVAVYAAHREVAERAVARINALAAATIINKNDEREDIPSSNTSIASFNTQSTTQNKQPIAKAPPPKTPLAPIKENVKGMLNSKTKEILDKISQAKSEIQ